MVTHLFQKYPTIKDFIDQNLFIICIRDPRPQLITFFVQNNILSFSYMVELEGMLYDEIYNQFDFYDKKLHTKKIEDLYKLTPIFEYFFTKSSGIDNEEYIKNRESFLQIQMTRLLLISCRGYSKLEEINYYIDNGANIHIDQDQPLIDACIYYDDLDIIKLLVESGSDVNAQNGLALVNACYEPRSLNIIKYLIECGADVNAQNGQALINVCSNSGGLDIVEYLVQKGANIHLQDDQAFIEACSDTDNFEVFEFLIQNGADINAQNGEALVKACFYPKDLRQIKYLIENGVDIHSQNDEALVSTCLEDGVVDVFGFLVENGANIHAQNGQALINACSRNLNFNILNYLVENGADVNAQNDQALIVASNFRNLDFIKYLLENGANINSQNGQPLISACKSRAPVEILRFLIENGADIYAQNCQPLTRLCNSLLWREKSFDKSFEYLLSLGADNGVNLEYVWVRVFSKKFSPLLLEYLIHTEVSIDFQSYLSMIDDFSDRIVDSKMKSETIEILAEKLSIITDRNFLLSFFRNPRFKVLKFFADKGIVIIKYKDFILDCLSELIGGNFRDLLLYLFNFTKLRELRSLCNFCEKNRLKCSCTDIYVHASYLDEIFVILLYLKKIGIEFSTSELQRKFGKNFLQLSLVDLSTISFNENKTYKTFYSESDACPQWLNNFYFIRRGK
ncbi:putative ankyrin repeat protein L25 [Smittium mucronatum]|uniref:Putative ankyrin repeat protein L25 n=1 Tax=Smittium mucronatum TaxID=133383 RepID=A0A1R0GN03_9FUNG|nr:putative ankyrin repeat protein L25 [Smittium mucronatum]